MVIQKNDELSLLRILLVEDDEHDRKAFRRALQKAILPSEIQECVRAEEAMVKLSDAGNPFDVLVTDYLLPGMNGLELCKELIDKKYPIPMVILTGSGSENVAVDALKSGVHEYIVKDPDQGYLKLLPFVIQDVVRKYIDHIRLLQAEEDFQKSRKAYKMVADFTYDWEYWIDPEDNYLYVSPSCRRITGYKPDDFISDPKLMDRIIHPEDLPAYLKHEKEVTQNRQPDSIDFRIITEAGEERWLGHVCQPVFDDDGRFFGKRGSNRDVTQQKKIQQERLRAHNMEAISILAGGIAHQFNNALSIITGNLDLLEEDLHGSDIAGDYATDMKNAAGLMKRLTMQLLAYARGGKYQADTKSLTIFLQDTLPIIRHAVHPDVRIETDLSIEPLSVNIDQTQMQMVLSAILSNASEAMDGEGIIHIHCRKVFIEDGNLEEWQPLPSGEYAELAIIDNGHGMDEITKSRIFEPFFTTNSNGRGLGMAAAFGIVQNHDGIITVSSDIGRGTAVTIHLPLVANDAAPKNLRSQTELEKGEEMILIIDDEESVIKVCRNMLVRLGYHVLEARTGSEAIEIVKKYGNRIDLVLLDVLIPDVKGNILYSIIKNLYKDIKVLVNSGYAFDRIVKDIIEAGAEGFIQKPFGKMELSSKIKEILEKNK